MAGCSDATGPAEDLRVTASVAPAEIQTGEIATVTITVRNAGSRTRQVFGSPPCDQPLTLTTAEGTVVRTALDPCIIALIAQAATPIAPGAQLVLTSRLRSNVARAPSSAQVIVPVPPGEYAIRGVVQAVDRDRVVPVSGPPVSLRILP